jgi:S-adenosylmethionine decarboxylase proenzyme
MMMRTTSRHVIAELYQCDDDILENLATIRREMVAAARAIRATVVGEVFHHFSPCGVSGVVVIAESHLSVHTWPESCYAAIDIFTCGELDPIPGVEFLAEAFRARRYRVQEILRGLSADREAEADLIIGSSRLVTVAPLCDLQPAEPLHSL